MKKKIIVGNHMYRWNGSYYEMKEIDPADRLFLDMRHKQTVIRLKRNFIDM